MFRKVILGFFILFLIVANLVVSSFHAGVFPPPKNLMARAGAHGQFIEKNRAGVNQLILSGTAFERGEAAGLLTADLLRKQETELLESLHRFFPNDLVVEGLILVAIQWFQGVQKYIEPWATDEMYGVSLSAPHEFDFLSDGYTRQVAYHGLHEVGQMMVDQRSDDMGCTVLASPYQNSWIVGRNFDFEGGRIFDEEKIVKWVYPSEGHAYVSVIWAGMVGVVTGANDQGLYISINAAGSKDFRRIGTPSTLVALKVLQFSSTADEALQILKRETMFITDIFVLLDSKSGKMYRVEKSPDRTAVIPLSSPVVVTNHLVAKIWENDATNLFRKNQLTSHYREARGLEIVKRLDAAHLTDPRQIELGILAGLRDKDGLELGNRRAIDSLIATHSVIYNGKDQILYVSHGPGVSGEFTGFDLRESFRLHRSVVTTKLPRDPLVSDQAFVETKASAKTLMLAQKEIRHHRCSSAKSKIETIQQRYRGHYEYFTALGDLAECEGHHDDAKANWVRALALKPAYAHEEDVLKEKINAKR